MGKRKWTFKQFVAKANKKFKSKYKYEEIKTEGEFTTNKMITVICPKHGKMKQRATGHLLRYVVGCRKCGCESQARKRSLTTKKFIKLARKAHGNKYDYSKSVYVCAISHIKIICRKCGVFEQKPHYHLRGHGCKKCVTRDWVKRRTIDPNIRIKNLKKKHSEYDYSKAKYTGHLNKLKVICSKHGQFMVRYAQHIQGSKCPKCAAQNVSRASQEWLDQLNVRRREFVLPNTKYRVDGYDPKTNTVFEYYGVFWHGSPDHYHPKDVNPINKKTYGQLYKDTMKRLKEIQRLGYKTVIKWEEIS